MAWTVRPPPIIRPSTYSLGLAPMKYSGSPVLPDRMVTTCGSALAWLSPLTDLARPSIVGFWKNAGTVRPSFN